MPRQRFDTAPEFRVADDSVVIQQVAGSSAPLLELKDHTGSALMSVNSSGQMTTSASTTFTDLTATGTVSLSSSTSIGSVSSTEIGYLDGVSSALQTQLNAKAPLASPTFTGTVNAGAISASSLALSGDLTVNGTTTTINSTALSVDDINITLGDTTSPTDTTANGGGITLKGSTDKTIAWNSATGSWGFSPSAVFTTVAVQGRGAAIAGDSAGGSAILQFTNNAVSAQWGSIVATSGGKLVLNSQTDGVGIGGTPTYPLHVQSSNYMIAAFQSSGFETKIDLINTSTNGRTYSIISGGSGGAFAGGIFGIWDNTASQVRIGINASGDIRLNGGLQMGSRSRTQNQTGGLGQVFGSVFSDEFATTNRVAYFGGTSGVSTWYGTTTKVFAAIDGNGSEGLSFWSNDSAGNWANIINYGASSITFNRVLSVATWRGSIDRAWDNYPSITIANTTDLGPQGEFRIHGYPGGSGGDYSINLRIDGSYLNLSDARIKTNVTPITSALDLVGNLNGVRYQKMNRSLQPETHTNINNGVKFGLIAQDSIEFIPECIAQTPNATPLENGWCDEYAMDYSQLTPLLIEAIKELTARVQQLEAAA